MSWTRPFKATANYRFLNIYIPYDKNIFSSTDEHNEFVDQYALHIDNHNTKTTTSVYKDAGFDVIMPEDDVIYFTNDEPTHLINLNINCSMYKYKENGDLMPVSYFLFPRSSTGKKTPIRLANSAGIIDSGYRGNIMACVDHLQQRGNNPSSCEFQFQMGERFFQLCSGDLGPILANLVYDKTALDLSTQRTERGNGGFGSTGRNVCDESFNID
jgi:dUTP pyrophosphatase